MIGNRRPNRMRVKFASFLAVGKTWGFGESPHVVPIWGGPQNNKLDDEAQTLIRRS